MKFLLDVYVASHILPRTLIDLGHDALSARDGHANASDEALLAIAYREDRVLVTEDKDFGELVFLRGLPHPCIVRLDVLTAMEEAAVMRDLIKCQGTVMRKGAIIVVTGRRVPIRSARNAESGND